MPSPFPGMNPYFEQRAVWRDFHGTFLGRLRAAFAADIGPRYFVAVEESMFIEADDGPGLFAVADVAVRDPGPPDRGTPALPTVTAPAVCVLPIPRRSRHRRRWLTVRAADERVIVTVIELLSPSDKRPGRDRDRYLLKRDRLLQSRANLVELDLLRGGHRTPTADPSAGDYRVLVSRSRERPRAGVWGVRLRDALPAIPIPLRPDDPEPLVPLKAVLDATYDDAQYARRIYDGEPDPPLSAADAEWARAFVPTEGA